MSFQSIIEEKLLPWARDGAPRLVMTGRATSPDQLPPGVHLTRKLPRGPRRATKRRSILANPRAAVAFWPRDGLSEVAYPLVVCVFDGRTDFWAGDQVVHCDAGHFLLLPAGLRHDAGEAPHYHIDPKHPDPAAKCDLFWIFHVGRVLRIFTCYSAGNVHHSREGEQADFINESAMTLLDLLFAEAEAGKPGWQRVCRDCLCALFELLRRDLTRGDILSSSRLGPAESRDAVDDPIAQAKTFVRGHLRDRPTIESVARAVYLSRAQFVRRFRRETGMTFGQYLAQCRLDEAQALLRHTDWELKRISDVVGLGSDSYFCQYFARHVGVSPQTFRQAEAGARTSSVLRSSRPSKPRATLSAKPTKARPRRAATQ